MRFEPKIFHLKSKNMGLPLSYAKLLSVADPGFPRELPQPHLMLTYCLANLYRKLHKNEKDWNTEGDKRPSPPLRCANASTALQAVVGGKARVWLTTLSRDLGPTALVQLVKEKVDLDLSGSHRTRISSTGTGSNFWQPEIESHLNIQ